MIPRLKNLLMFWGKLSLGGGLLYLLFAQTNIDELLTALKQIDIKYVIASIIVSCFSVYIKAFKWQRLLALQGGGFTVGRAVSLMYMSMFFNNFFLGTLGGDGFRAVKTYKDTDSKAGAVSAILMDRFTGVVALVLVVVISASGCLIFGSTITEIPLVENILILGLVALVVSIVGFAIFLRMDNSFLRKHDHKLIKFLADIMETLARHRLTSKVVLLSFFLSVLYHLTTVVAMYYFTLAIGLQINILELFVVVPIVSFVIMMPVSVNGIGLQEGVFFYYFLLIGVSNENALLLSLLPRLGMLVLSVIGAILFLLEKNKNP